MKSVFVGQLPAVSHHRVGTLRIVGSRGCISGGSGGLFLPKNELLFLLAFDGAYITLTHAGIRRISANEIAKFTDEAT